MSEPFVGEVTAYAFDWAPKGYALCDGSLLPLGQNQALFSLLGTTFGGNGSSNFALPDLRGRSPLGIGQQPGGSNYNQGAAGGSETVQLTLATVPPHLHVLNAAVTNGNNLSPAGNLIATVVPSGTSSQNLSSYKGPGWTADAALNPGSVSPAGGNIGHNNMQPFTVVNFCIATQGIYPSRP